jgi:hypothetical protein
MKAIGPRIISTFETTTRVTYLKLSDLCSLSETTKIILECNNYTLNHNLSITTQGENVMQIIPNAIQKPMVV